MRHVFINVGAGKGSDIDGFLKIDPSYSNWEIFAFECNPELIKTISKKYPNIQLIPLAASTVDQSSKLYLGNSYVNSSLISSKINVFEERYLEVGTIDISKWLMDNFKKEDYIILTLDIEGAEYPIIEKMINDGSLDLIDELYIEFHGKKIPDITLEYEKSLVNYLISRFKDKVYIYEYHNHEQFIKLNQEAIKR